MRVTYGLKMQQRGERAASVQYKEVKGRPMQGFIHYWCIPMYPKDRLGIDLESNKGGGI
jgi:hypothetical protein